MENFKDSVACQAFHTCGALADSYRCKGSPCVFGLPVTVVCRVCVNVCLKRGISVMMVGMSHVIYFLTIAATSMFKHI